MNDTNYIGSIVKIVETPKKKIIKNNVLVTTFRAQVPQLRGNRLVRLTFWGNLARDVLVYYKINDYLIIEGYIAMNNKQIKPSLIQKQKKVEITVLKIYPFLLNYENSVQKT